jgi:hypothetical protein
LGIDLALIAWAEYDFGLLHINMAHGFFICWGRVAWYFIDRPATSDRPDPGLVVVGAIGWPWNGASPDHEDKPLPPVCTLVLCWPPAFSLHDLGHPRRIILSKPFQLLHSILMRIY